MRIVTTTFTCDRCSQNKDVRGDNEHPPLGWATSRLDTHVRILTPLLCDDCRRELLRWYRAGGTGAGGGS